MVKGREKFKETEDKNLEIFQAYESGGRFDISKLVTAELGAFKIFYLEHLAEIESPARAELLEQFLLLNSLNSEESIAVAKTLTSDERESLGEFVGKNLNPELRYPLFHYLWFNLSETQQDFFIRKFTREVPASAIMIAPFVNLQDFVTEDREAEHPFFIPRQEFIAKSEEKYTRFAKPGKYRAKPPGLTKPSKEISLFNKYFNNFEGASRFMEACFAAESYARENLSAVSKEDQENELELIRNQSGLGLGLKIALLFYQPKIGENYSFLFSYLPRLVKYGFLDQEQAQEFLLSPVKYFRSAFYETNEDQKRIKLLVEKAAKFNLPRQDYYSIEEMEVQPHNLLREYHAIFNEAYKTGVRHILKNSSEYLKFIREDARLKFFKNLSNSGVPIFLMVKDIGLSKNELKDFFTIIDPEDDYTHLRDLSDLKVLLDIGLEKEVVRYIIYQIVEAGSDIIIGSVLDDADEFFSWFEESNRLKIIKAINAFMPYMWLNNLDYALRHKVVALPEFFDTVDEYELMNRYQNLLYDVERLNKQYNLGVGRDMLKKIAKNFFETSPSSIFYYKNIFADVYSKVEQEYFIKERITGKPDAEFIASAIGRVKNKQAPENKEEKIIDLLPYVADLRGALLAEPAILNKIFENINDGWQAVINLMPPAKRFGLFFEAAHSLDAADFSHYSSVDLLLDFADHPQYISRLIEWLRQSDNLTLVGNFLESARAYVKYGGGSLSEPKPKEQIENFKIIYAELISLVKELVKKDERSIFNTEILDNLDNKDLDLQDIISRNAKEYAQIHPGFLRELKKVLPEDLYESLFLENIRSAAFLRGKYNYPIYDREDLSRELRESLSALDPFFRVRDLAKDNILPEGYYQLVLKDIKNNPFLGLYKKQLESIAADELKTRGVQRNVEGFKPNKNFYKKIVRLALLVDSKEATLMKDVILNLDEKEREEILGMLGFILLHDLDKRDGHVKVAILDLGENFENSKRSLNQAIAQFVGKLFELSESDVERLKEEFLPLEILKVLSEYYESVRGQQDMKSALQNFVMTASTKDFESRRAWGVTSREFNEESEENYLESLKRENLLPLKLTLPQYLAWLRTNAASFDEVLEINESNVKSGIKQAMSQAVADGHIKKEELEVSFETAKETYDLVSIPMAEYSRRMEELRKKHAAIKEKNKREGTKEQIDPAEQEEYKKLQSAIVTYRKENQDKIQRAEGAMYLAHLRNINISEIENEALIIGTRRVPFKKSFDLLESLFRDEYPGFIQDLERVRNLIYESRRTMFGDEKISKSKLKLTDGVDLETHLKIGEVPVESCQHYSGGSYNMGLLAYSLDPNVRIIQVRDDVGRLIARSILRLLGDSAQSPALFLERIYSVNPHKKIREAIINFGESKAQSLGVPLYTHGLEGMEEAVLEEAGGAPTADLVSLSSRAPYVYTDAGGGRARLGKYTVHGAIRIK